MPLFSRSASTIVPYSEALVYETLIDYNGWSEWFSFLSSSRLLTREGDLAIAELGWAGGGGKTAILECIQTTNKAVLLRAVEGSIPFRQIEWLIGPADPGFARVTVTVSRTCVRPPRILHPSRWLAALGPALAAARPGPEPVPGGENIFELWETEKGLVCWVRGRKYALVPSDE